MILEKRGLQISFAWLFAIIVGATVLFLAIYASTQIIDTGETRSSAETAKQIGVLLNPLETGFETGTTTTLSLPAKTRIYNRCDNRTGNFGRQIIKVSQQSFGEWTDTGVDVGFSNKHIFSENFVEGQDFYLFSKPFNFPFKVADVIYITSAEKDYCFSNPPERIENEIRNLNQGNLYTEDCPENSVRVCFNSNDECDVEVDEGEYRVFKDGESMNFYSDSLMYGAIFSEKEIYECQLQRLMMRGERLSNLYLDKAEFISQRNCNSNAVGDLSQLASLESSLKSSFNLNTNMIDKAESAKDKNEFSECKLW